MVKNGCQIGYTAKEITIVRESGCYFQKVLIQGVAQAGELVEVGQKGVFLARSAC
jgi:hypothetical protein